VRQGAATTISSPARQTLATAIQIPDWSGTALPDRVLVGPETGFDRARRWPRPVYPTIKAVGPPYAATHWRSRATRNASADGEVRLRRQRERRRKP